LGDDDDDIDCDSRQVLLSEDDPRLLETSLSDDLKRALNRFQSGVEITISNALHGPAEETLVRSVVSLRFIRGVSQQPVREASSGHAPLSLQFGAPTISLVQSKLARFASSLALSGFKTSLAALAGAERVSAKLLWEGSPALPTLPSPPVFQFLYKLTERMASFGLDLWSADTVLVLKRGCFEELMEPIKEYAHQLSEPRTASPVKDADEAAAGNASSSEGDSPGSGLDAGVDGIVEEDMDDSKTKDKAVQLLFDMLYLQWSLGSGASPSVFGDVFSTLVRFADLEESDISRVKRGSREYWRRTYLVFALLCTESIFSKT
jgi:hypothetical protein